MKIYFKKQIISSLITLQKIYLVNMLNIDFKKETSYTPLVLTITDLHPPFHAGVDPCT